MALDKKKDKKQGETFQTLVGMAIVVERNKTYLETHPWITLRANLQSLPHTFWMEVGEARSKCQYIAGVPLLPKVAQQLYHVYLSKGVHATTSIEGNTLSEEQVQQRIEGKLKLPRSQQYLGNEIDNIIKACNDIEAELLMNPTVVVTTERILEFNALVLRGTNTEREVVPGEFRRYSVGVMGYRGAPWEDCRFLIDKLCTWLSGPDFDSDDPEMKFVLSLLKAILAHLYIAWIHPFGDGNGRTARLLEVQVLMQSGVPYPACHLLSNHYNKTRTQYYAELDRSSKKKDGYLSFVEYAVRGFVDGLREQTEYIRNCQWKVTWENYVHDQFRDKDTPACSRQKHLVLDMPDAVTAKRDLTLVSPRVASEYAGKGEKTLTRDLNALLKMQLIRKIRKGFIPNRDRILAFLPTSIDEMTERPAKARDNDGRRSIATQHPG
jgi:Fic family protein